MLIPSAPALLKLQLCRLPPLSLQAQQGETDIDDTVQCLSAGHRGLTYSGFAVSDRVTGHLPALTRTRVQQGHESLASSPSRFGSRQPPRWNASLEQSPRNQQVISALTTDTRGTFFTPINPSGSLQRTMLSMRPEDRRVFSDLNQDGVFSDLSQDAQRTVRSMSTENQEWILSLPREQRDAFFHVKPQGQQELLSSLLDEHQRRCVLSNIHESESASRAP